MLPLDRVKLPKMTAKQMRKSEPRLIQSVSIIT